MKKKGFTLIELLAVIAILAIVLLIAIPTVLNMIERSRRGAFRNEALTIIKAAKDYVGYVNTGESDDNINWISNKAEIPINKLNISENNIQGAVLLEKVGKEITYTVYIWNGIYAICGVENPTNNDVIKSNESCGGGKGPSVSFTPESTLIPSVNVIVGIDVFDKDGVEEKKYAWILHNETIEKGDPRFSAIPADGSVNSMDDLGYTDGRYRLAVYARDSLGNESIVLSGTYEISTTIPEGIIITSDCATQCSSATITIHFLGVSPPPIQMYRIDAGKWTNYTGPFVVTANGTITAMANDGINSVYETYEITNIIP